MDTNEYLCTQMILLIAQEVAAAHGLSLRVDLDGRQIDFIGGTDAQQEAAARDIADRLGEYIC